MKGFYFHKFLEFLHIFPTSTDRMDVKEFLAFRMKITGKHIIIRIVIIIKI